MTDNLTPAGPPDPRIPPYLWSRKWTALLLLLVTFLVATRLGADAEATRTLATAIMLAAPTLIAGQAVVDRAAIRSPHGAERGPAGVTTAPAGPSSAEALKP